MFRGLRNWYRCHVRGQHDWRQGWRTTWDERIIPNGHLTCMRCLNSIVVQSMSSADRERWLHEGDIAYARIRAKLIRWNIISPDSRDD